MRKGDEGGVEERTWMMTLVHIDVHVRARPIGVVGGAGRESNACFLFCRSLVWCFTFYVPREVREEWGRKREGKKEKDVRKGTALQPPPKLVVCLDT